MDKQNPFVVAWYNHNCVNIQRLGTREQAELLLSQFEEFSYPCGIAETEEELAALAERLEKENP